MLTELVLFLFIASSIINLFYVLVFRRTKQPIEPEKLPKVSVMTYAYTGDWAGNVIKRKIENFLKLNYPKNKMEIIVYDNGSTGKALKICEEYAKKGLIKHYRSDKGYNRKGLVLDDAIRNVAKGDIIALTDPDGVCERNWLIKHVRVLMSDKKIGATNGMVFCGNWYKNLMTKMRAIEDVWMMNIAYFGRAKFKVEQFICGANYCFKKKAWKDVGGHGKTLAEDEEMAENLKKKGWKIAFVDSCVWQEEVESIKHFFVQRLRWYSMPAKFIFQGKETISTIISLNPVLIQTMGLISLLFFVFSNSVAVQFVSITIFLVSILSIIIGLLKMKEGRLAIFVPLYLTMDSLLSVACFVLARGFSLFDKEVSWDRLSHDKYYHNGTRIRINREYLRN